MADNFSTANHSLGSDGGHWVVSVDLSRTSVWQQIGVFPAVIATLISVVHIVRHLRHNKSPALAWVELKLLFVVPLFAVDAAISLSFQSDPMEWAKILTAFREFYESVVLVSFVQFLLLFLGRKPEQSMVEEFRVTEVQGHLWFFNGTYRVVGRQNQKPRYGNTAGYCEMYYDEQSGDWCLSLAQHALPPTASTTLATTSSYFAGATATFEAPKGGDVAFRIASDGSSLFPPEGKWQHVTEKDAVAVVHKAGANPTMILGDVLSQRSPAKSLKEKLLWGPYLPGANYVASVLTGILQYVVVMNLVLFTNTCLWIWAVSDDAGAHCANPNAEMWSGEWIRMHLEGAANGLKGMSCGLALYHLGLIYMETSRNEATKEQLENINPELKFIMVKGIIFFTFWQSAVFGILHRLDPTWLPIGLDNEGVKWCPEYVADGMKNFLLCWEMLGFAIGHTYAYPANEFNGWEARLILQNAIIKGSKKELKEALEYAKKCGLEDFKIDVQKDTSRWLTNVHDGLEMFTATALDDKKVKVHMDFRAPEGAVDTSYPVCIAVQEKLVAEANVLLNELELKGSEKLVGEKSVAGVGQKDHQEAHAGPKSVGYIKELIRLYHDIIDLRNFAKRCHRAAKLVKESDAFTKTPSKSGSTEDDLFEAFNTIDRDGSKKIDKFELRHVLIAANVDMKEEEIEKLFERMEKERGQGIDLEGFRGFVAKAGEAQALPKGKSVPTLVDSGLDQPLLDDRAVTGP